MHAHAPKDHGRWLVPEPPAEKDGCMPVPWREMCHERCKKLGTAVKASPVNCGQSGLTFFGPEHFGDVLQVVYFGRACGPDCDASRGGDPAIHDPFYPKQTAKPIASLRRAAIHQGAKSTLIGLGSASPREANA